MQASKEYSKEKGYNRLSFSDGQPHTVTLIKDRRLTITTNDGEKEGVEFEVTENGEVKTFFTSSMMLISELAEHSPNDTVTIQLKNKSINGQFKKIYEITAVDMKGSMGDQYAPSQARNEAVSEDINPDDIPF